jgi:hypothetical protein
VHFPTLQPYLLDGATVPWFRFLFYGDDMRTPFLIRTSWGKEESGLCILLQTFIHGVLRQQYKNLKIRIVVLPDWEVL